MASRVEKQDCIAFYQCLGSVDLVSQSSQPPESYLRCKQSSELSILCSHFCQLLSGFMLLHITVTDDPYALIMLNSLLVWD